MMFNRTMHGTQRGVATILIVLLIALSLTAAVLLGVQYNRSLQEQSISLHAQTAAQSKAWETAEIVRQYFDELQKGAGFDTLFTSIENELAEDEDNVLALSGLDSTTTATLQNAWKDSDDIPHFGVLIESTAAAGTKAEAKAQLEVVISYTDNMGSHGTPSAGYFVGDTDLSGNISIYADGGKSYNITVDGNITIGKGNVKEDESDTASIKSILSTKSIKIDGMPNVFEKLHANCDIRLESSSAKYIYARNNICLAPGKESEKNEEIKANNSIYIKNGSSWGDIKALAATEGIEGIEPFCASDANKYCNDKVNFKGVYLDGAGAESIETIGDGEIIGGDGVKVAHIAPVPSVTVDEAELNVMEELENHANYVFEYDKNNQRMLVTVRNVKDIYSGADKNGKKFELRTVGNGKNKKENMLCPLGVTGDAECRGPIVSDGGSIKYGQINIMGDKFDSWSIEGSIAPGLVIFKGKLFLNEGSFVNTIAATDNIIMKGGKLYSLNWTGYDGDHGSGNNRPPRWCMRKQACR